MIDRLNDKLWMLDKIIEKEGDHHEWVNKETGYKCEIIRHDRRPSINWCGYVTIPKTHKWYGTAYDELDVDVHGGLTYECDGKYGFDCAHLDDIWSLNLYIPLPIDSTYKTKEWVIEETDNLARQFGNK